jgi:hypothetical protein
MAAEKDTHEKPSAPSTGQGITLDWWSVIVALALGALILAGIIPAIPW